jgi:hypothetical protein
MEILDIDQYVAEKTPIQEASESFDEGKFVLNEMVKHLEGVKSKMYDYIDDHFSQQEAQKHSENLMHIVGGYEAAIATIKMKLLKGAKKN